MGLLVTDGCDVLGSNIQGFVRQHDQRSFIPSVAVATAAGNLENHAVRLAVFEGVVRR